MTSMQRNGTSVTSLKSKEGQKECKIKPAMISAPPLMYLEILCTTTSAPNFAGDSTIGAKVLSTTTVTPFSCAILLNTGTLATVNVGFETDSKYSTFVLPSTIASSTISKSLMSTNDVVMLQALGKKCVSNAWVPPYSVCEATTCPPTRRSSLLAEFNIYKFN